MPLWTNTVKPKWDFVSNTTPRHGYNRRNIVATDAGWVHRTTYTDVHGVARKKDEILVAIPRLGSAAKGHAFPSVVDIYTANTTGGTTLRPGLVNKVYLVFNEPVNIANLKGQLNLAITNTNASGSDDVIAVSNNTATAIAGADNTLEFKFVANTAGGYKVSAQTMSNTATWTTLTGNVSATTGSNNISWSGVGTQTNFTAQLTVGAIIKIGTDATPIRIHSIANTTRAVGVARVAGNQTNKGYTLKGVASVYSRNTGNESANLYITSAVSNTYGTFTIPA